MRLIKHDLMASAVASCCFPASSYTCSCSSGLSVPLVSASTLMAPSTQSHGSARKQNYLNIRGFAY